MREIKKPLVSIIDSDPDICDSYEMIFADAGYATRFLFFQDLSSPRPKDQTILFLLSDTPQLLLFDICPPIERCWKWFQALQVMHPQQWEMLPVTTSPQALQAISNLTQQDMLIKPFNLDTLLEKIETHHPLRRGGMPSYSYASMNVKEK